MINKRMHFDDKTKIYDKLLNIFAIYLIIYAIIMFIAGGDGIYFGIYAIGFVIVMYSISKLFGKINKQIKHIEFLDDNIVFQYFLNNKLETEKFNLTGLKINAIIAPSLYFDTGYRFYYSIHPQALIILTIEQNDGSIFQINDSSDDIDHSLKLLKFLTQLECFSYKFQIDTWGNTEYSIKLENAIGNYLKNNIYDKKIFKLYQRVFSGLIGVLGFLFIQLLNVIIITLFGLEMVFHIVV